MQTDRIRDLEGRDLDEDGNGDQVTGFHRLFGDSDGELFRSAFKTRAGESDRL